MTIFFRLLSSLNEPNINPLKFAFYNEDTIPVDEWNNWLNKWWDRVNGKPNQEKMEQFYEHLEASFIQVGFYDTNNPKKLMHRIRRLFNRARLYESEWKILCGFISKIQKK